jgi:LysM repeat protein
VDIALLAVYNSYRRSIEHTFDGSGTPNPWGGRQMDRHRNVSRYGDLGRDAQLREVAVEDSERSLRRETRPSVRLTSRGRLLAVALFLVLSFVLVSVSSALHSATQAGTGPAAPATRFVTVQPGQTLWQIALRVAPRDDPRDTVDRIRTLNDLDTTAVLPGQRLVVPA